MTDDRDTPEKSPREFTLFTTHGLALLAIGRNPSIRVREIANEIGITQRAVQRILDDLCTIGYLAVTREGRRNSYRIQPDRRLHHPLLRHLSIGSLLDMMLPEQAALAETRQDV